MSDLEDQHEEVRNGKGSRRISSAVVTSHDSRVSRGIALALGVLGVLAVAAITWVGTSINNLNVNVARVLERMDAKDKRDDAQDNRISRTEDRLEDLTGDVRTLEGKNLRGHPEPSRGR